MTASRTFPKRIKLAGENATVVIQWSDDHISSYSYKYLRGKCPCATCNELGPPPEKFVNPLPILGQKSLKPDRAELVGRYAGKDGKGEELFQLCTEHIVSSSRIGHAA